MTSEEIKKEHISKMGEELGLLFYSVHNDFININVKWKEYQELFMSHESRISVLNDTASFFFYNIQRIMIDDLVVNITRLAESSSAGSRKSKNATLKTIIDLIEDQSLQQRLRVLYSRINKDMGKLNTWRRKKVAHRDYFIHTNAVSKPQIGLEPKDIRQTLSSIESTMLSIYKYFFNAHFMYNHIDPRNSALSLLHYLDLGKRAEIERIKVLKSGQPSKMEFAHIRHRSFE